MGSILKLFCWFVVDLLLELLWPVVQVWHTAVVQNRLLWNK